MPNPRTSLAFAVALLAAPALAAPPQTYFTFGAARGGFEAVAPGGCTLNETSSSATGGTLGVGYAFSEHLAVEFGFANLGTLDLQGVCGIAATPFTLTAPDKGLQLSGVLSLPLGDAGEARGFTAYGRLGAFSWSENAQSGTEAIVGGGLEWRFSFNTALRLEYDAFGSDVDAIQLTLRWDY